MRNRVLILCWVGLLLSSFASWGQDQIPNLEQLQEESQDVDWSQATSHSVIIKAPLSEVWSYASNSSFAHDWSVFFDHISPLPGIEDGKVGSLRRCFRNANELGERWDEKTILVQPQRMRIITTFNLVGFRFARFAKKNYVFVRQLYRAIDENTTVLTFQTHYSRRSGLFTRWAVHRAQSDTKKIFAENLMNIKAAIEGMPRLYNWQSP